MRGDGHGLQFQAKGQHNLEMKKEKKVVCACHVSPERRARSTKEITRVGGGRVLTRLKRVGRLAHQHKGGVCKGERRGGRGSAFGSFFVLPFVAGKRRSGILFFFLMDREDRGKRKSTFRELPDDGVRGRVASELSEAAVADSLHDVRHLLDGGRRKTRVSSI